MNRLHSLTDQIRHRLTNLALCQQPSEIHNLTFVRVLHHRINRAVTKNGVVRLFNDGPARHQPKLKTHTAGNAQKQCVHRADLNAVQTPRELCQQINRPFASKVRRA